MPDILAICGSLRKASFNRMLLEEALRVAPPELRFSVADISTLPLFNDDLMEAGKFPEVVERLRAQVRASDGLLIASPEYNRSVPAPLKNALDWLSHRPAQPLDGKMTAIIGTSSGALGAAFANHHLRQMLVYLNAPTLVGPEVAIPYAATKFDARRLVDQSTISFLSAHMRRFADHFKAIGSSD